MALLKIRFMVMGILPPHTPSWVYPEGNNSHLPYVFISAYVKLIATALI